MVLKALRKFFLKRKFITTTLFFFYSFFLIVLFVRYSQFIVFLLIIEGINIVLFAYLRMCRRIIMPVYRITFFAYTVITLSLGVSILVIMSHFRRRDKLRLFYVFRKNWKNISRNFNYVFFPRFGYFQLFRKKIYNNRFSYFRKFKNR